MLWLLWLRNRLELRLAQGSPAPIPIYRYDSVKDLDIRLDFFPISQAPTTDISTVTFLPKTRHPAPIYFFPGSFCHLFIIIIINHVKFSNKRTKKIWKCTCPHLHQEASTPSEIGSQVSYGFWHAKIRGKKLVAKAVTREIVCSCNVFWLEIRKPVVDDLLTKIRMSFLRIRTKKKYVLLAFPSKSITCSDFIEELAGFSFKFVNRFTQK